MTQKLMFQGEGAPERGIMTVYDVDPGQSVGRMEASLEYCQETGWCGVPHSRRMAPFHFGACANSDHRCDYPGNQRPSQPNNAGALQPCSAGSKEARGGSVERSPGNPVKSRGDSESAKLIQGPRKIPHKIKNGSGVASVSC